MSKEIDVREMNKEREIKAIRFGDDDNRYSEYPPCKLVLGEGGSILLMDHEDDSVTNLDCLSDEDIKNLIKALKQAVKLGWFRDIDLVC